MSQHVNWLSFLGNDFRTALNVADSWCLGLLLCLVMAVPTWHRWPPLLLSLTVFPPCPAHSHPQRNVPSPLSVSGLLSPGQSSRLSGVEPYVWPRRAMKRWNLWLKYGQMIRNPSSLWSLTKTTKYLASRWWCWGSVAQFIHVALKLIWLTPMIDALMEENYFCSLLCPLSLHNGLS